MSGVRALQVIRRLTLSVACEHWKLVIQNQWRANIGNNVARE